MPSGGQVILGSRATPIPGGWRYEYALYNMSCDAGIGRLWVSARGSAPANIGFHDVAYTDGDGENNVTRDGTDWPGAYEPLSGRISWEAVPYSTNPNGNGLLWGTLYNFRFDSPRPPITWLVGVSQWKTSAGVYLEAQVPLPLCYANCDGSTLSPILNVQDFSCFLNKFSAGDSYANCDLSTNPPVLNVQDFGCFLNLFALGCFS
jgi:hypothetical protein